MKPYFYMNGNGDARNNDFSTHDDSQTTNHIYLHPGPNQGEFDNWMRKIGPLLQVASEHTALKPVLELIIAVFEPQRLFLINHPSLPELDVETYTEILVVMDRSQITSKKMTKGMLEMACLRQSNLVINFETAAKFDRAISNGHPHYCIPCNEETLVFSGSPYRLQSPSIETLDELKTELSEKLDWLFAQAGIFLSEADRLKSQSPNVAALMLHHCLEFLYKNVLVMCTHKFYNTHRLAKLHIKVEKYMPQVSAKLSVAAVDALDKTLVAITTPYYSVDKVWGAEGVFDEIGKALKVTKAVIEKRTERLFEGCRILEQSENSEL